MRILLWDSARVRQKVDTLWLIYKEIESCRHVTFESLVQKIRRSRGTIASGVRDLLSSKLIQKDLCPTCGYKRAYSVVGDVKELAIKLMLKEGLLLEPDIGRQEYFEYYLHWFLPKRVVAKERGRKRACKHELKAMNTKEIVRFYEDRKKS